MKNVETYAKVSSIATSEDEEKTEVKVKLSGTWELDGTKVDIIVVMKGTQYDIHALFDQENIVPGLEYKLIIREGAQASLIDFATKEELEESEEEEDPEEGPEEDPEEPSDPEDEPNLRDWSESPSLTEDELTKKKKGRKRKSIEAQETDKP